MRAGNEGHQRMHRRDRGACFAQRIQFAAGERSAGVQGETGYNFLLKQRVSNQVIRQNRSRAANLTIWNAEPQQDGVQRGGMCGDGLSAHLRGQRASALARSRQVARYDLGNWETRSEEHTSELQSPCNLV